jgi:hypothetical protein
MLPSSSHFLHCSLFILVVYVYTFDWKASHESLKIVNFEAEDTEKHFF